MLVKRPATLQDTLSLRELPPSGTAWHELLLQGLPYKSLRSTAKALCLKESELAAHLGLKGPQLAARKRARRLNAPESDLLHAIALAYTKLASFKGVVGARQWLLEPCEMLKNARPIDLLRTRLGTEYVSTAIARIRPAPTFTTRVEDDENEEEEDFE